MRIENHKLIGPNIPFIDTPNKGGKFKAGNLNTIVIHYTAGPSALSAVNTLVNPRVKASAHLIIERDGSITQMVDFDRIAWHAGRSFFGKRTGFNRYSIGIELVNAGPLKKLEDKYVAWYGTKYDSDDVIYATHKNQNSPRYWQVFTEEQMAVTREICLLLMEEYGIDTILGHDEISPKHKIDPGPAFPLDKFREKLLTPERNEDKKELEPVKSEGAVSASSLNIRVSPDVEAEKVTQALKNGTKVTILDEQEGWLKVRTEVEGWVYGKYIE